ncbi:MAG: TetR family transcriptional regulator [Acidimicrobiaceae bacterium]|nr:TetR family transcriptional regulator [Acidimicrobiaceae bacterium]
MSTRHSESLTSGTPRRTDALRNRERILSVAYRAFSDDPDVSLNMIAKLAGVGPGTLYRNFPTRESLILALYRHEVQAVVDSVPSVLAEHEPLDALRVWFLRLAEYVRLKHGLGEALHTAAAQDVINETYAPVTAAVGQLLNAAEQAGQVRPGLDPADILLLMGFLWRVGPGESGRRQAERILEIVTENLQTKA